MHIEINEKFLGELKHTAQQLREAEGLIRRYLAINSAMQIADTIETAHTLIDAIVDSAEKGVEARPRIIKRENEETGEYHTHVILTSFCISNEWLGDK